MHEFFFNLDSQITAFCCLFRTEKEEKQVKETTMGAWRHVLVVCGLLFLASTDLPRPANHKVQPTSWRQNGCFHRILQKLDHPTGDINVKYSHSNTKESLWEQYAAWLTWEMPFKVALASAQQVDDGKTHIRNSEQSGAPYPLHTPVPTTRHDSSEHTRQRRDLEINQLALVNATNITGNATFTPLATPSPSPSEQRETFGTSLTGCECLSRCGTTFDTLVPWCEVRPTCDGAKFDGIRRQYWDQCALDPADREFFNRFSDAWAAMVSSAVISASTIYLIAGIQAWRASFRQVNLRSLIWLPCIYVLFGAVTSLVFSSLMCT